MDSVDSCELIEHKSYQKTVDKTVKNGENGKSQFCSKTTICSSLKNLKKINVN